jgi:hypothetical protein
LLVANVITDRLFMFICHFVSSLFFTVAVMAVKVIH